MTVATVRLYRWDEIALEKVTEMLSRKIVTGEREMIAQIDAAIEAGDSIGGSFIVVAEGMPIGIGSNSEWDVRIDTSIAAALMGIQAVKGVEIGLGFGVVSRRGSEVHDEVVPGARGWQRRTNRAGGTEGGMTNGAAIVARVAKLRAERGE